MTKSGSDFSIHDLKCGNVLNYDTYLSDSTKLNLKHCTWV